MPIGTSDGDYYENPINAALEALGKPHIEDRREDDSDRRRWSPILPSQYDPKTFKLDSLEDQLGILDADASTPLMQMYKPKPKQVPTS